MKIKTDDQGLIVQLNGDAGDTAARTGEWYLGYHLNEDPDFKPPISFEDAIGLLEPNKDGVLLRYNRSPYNDPFKGDFATSRDQTNPNIIAAGFYKHFSFLKRISKAQLKRFGLYQNKDVASPEHVGIFIRALYQAGLKWLIVLYPFLLLGDVFNLINSVVRIVSGRLDHDDVGDDINHIQVCIQNALVLPTPISWLSRKIYKKFRYGGPQYAMDHYHRPESGGNPLNELYRPILED